MIRYHYRAATAEGQMVEGVLQAPSERLALEELRRQRLYPVDVQQLAPAEKAMRPERVGRNVALALWTRTLATMLGASVPLDRALGFTADQIGNESVAAAARETRREVEGGASLADALRRQPKAFSPLYVAMVAAGEASGALEQVMERLADHLDEANELRSQVRAALLYPALMAVVSSLGVMVLLLFVVPRFVAMLQDVGGKLPVSTRILVGISRVVVGLWWVWLPLALVGAFAVRAWISRPENRARLHAWRLGWPMAGDLERKYITARFARTLGLLLRSGMGILPALRIARSAVGNLALGARLDRAAADVSQGKRLAAALSDTLPPLAAQLIAVGEESGRLDELCLRTADTYDAEVRRALRTLVSLVEPAMILIFGALVGFVALAMLQAIYSVNTSVV